MRTPATSRALGLYRKNAVVSGIEDFRRGVHFAARTTDVYLEQSYNVRTHKTQHFPARYRGKDVRVVPVIASVAKQSRFFSR